ncbi:hypothetical protein N7492_003121 [Penicillium capsulatum]|uniref:Zn(2)-C6 fungal-type domain-containing protein n=1 Tax=Penicillium capsulatum TaxID=69766 RepID=A0A9W9IQF1_9EURO|nr:hypothetical protein N7492_003121 [Penicillium capsulatum]KAJ6122289.1 hypothetical protein N7512_004754 [Penicillium capsulatum]
MASLNPTRARRVKCDEQRPACKRCIGTGRVCPGYPDATSQKAEIKIYNIPFKVPGSRADRELLHFYCTEAAGRLSRFSRSDLWTCLVLQRSQHQPVIRNALVALSALYRDYLQSGSSGLAASPKHIQLITRSHKQLRAHLLSPNASPEAALICSLMFYVFECLVGNARQAIWHLDQGLVLLQRCCTFHPALMQDPIFVQLFAVFSQLDIHASVFSGERAPVLDLALPEQISGAASVVPDSFSSLDQAEGVMVILQNWTMRHLVQYVEYKQKAPSKVPFHVKRERLHSEAEFRRFEQAIQSLAPGPDERSDDQQGRIMLLHTHALIFRGVLLENNFCDMDEFNVQAEASYTFEIALDKAARLLLSFSKPPPGRVFTLSTNIIAMLYFICMKTTDRHILQQTLSLMRGSLFAARDGLWDSNAATLMVEAMLPEDALVESDTSELAIKLEDIGAGIVDAAGNFDDAYQTLQCAQRAFSESTTPESIP